MANLIGEQTIKLVGDRVMGLMREYHSAINRVYDEDGKIKISMGLEIKFEQQKNKVRVGIKFVTDQIDDESVGWADEFQGDLFKDRYQENPPRENELEGATPVPELSRKLLPSPEGAVVDAVFQEGGPNPEGPTLNEFGCNQVLKDGRCPRFEELEIVFCERACCRGCEEAHDCADVCEMATKSETKPPEGETEGAPDETTALKTYRINDRHTEEWWEGQASDADRALALAWEHADDPESFSVQNCDIEVQNALGEWTKLNDDPLVSPPAPEPPLDCHPCSNHRGMRSKFHGIKIPGQYGKCIREGGPCEAGQAAIKKEAA